MARASRHQLRRELRKNPCDVEQYRETESFNRERIAAGPPSLWRYRDFLPCAPEDPSAGLAAFTVPGAAQAIWKAIETDLSDDGAEHMTADYGERLVEQERCAYLRPTIVHCKSTKTPIAGKEYMYPFATVVQCPQDKIISSIGQTLVCTAITQDVAFRQALTDAVHIDRLNLGAIPTTQLNWLQPHEGNIVDFLFRARALQVNDK